MAPAVNTWTGQRCVGHCASESAATSRAYFPSKPRSPSDPYAATLQRCMLALMMPISHDGHMNVGLCASDVLPPSTHASHLRLQAFVPSHSMQAPHRLSILQCLTSTLQAFQVMEKKMLQNPILAEWDTSEALQHHHEYSQKCPVLF